MVDNSRKGGRGILKKLVIAAGVIVALLVVAVIVAPRLIPWEKVRQEIELKGSEALNREVRVKGLSVGLLSGVEITGFRIGPAKGQDGPDLVSADRVVARYRLLPLLWLKVVVNKVELVEPKLFAGKDARGNWSFADLVAGGPAPAAGAKAKPLTLPVTVDVDSIKVTGGSLSYRDASAKPVFTAGVGNLDVMVRGFTLSGALAALKASCVVKMDSRTVAVDASGRIGVNLNRSLVTLKDLLVILPGIRATVSGEITEIQVMPTMKLEVHAAVDLPAVWTGYAGFIPKGVADMMSLAGTVTADVRVGGTQKKLSLAGAVDAKAVSVNMKAWPGAFENMEGKIEFTEDSVSIDGLRFFSFASPFTFSCQITNLGFARPMEFAYAKFSPKGKFSAACPKLVLDSLLPPPVKLGAGEAGAKPATPPPPPPEPDFRGMIPNGVEVEGDIRIDEVRARKLVLSKEKAKVRIKGQTIACEFSDGSYGGQQTGTGKIVLSSYPVQFEAAGSLSGLQVRPVTDDSIEAFIAGAGAAKGRVDGTAKAEYNLSCKGIMVPSLRKGIKGTMLVLVENGKVSKLSFLKALGKVLKTEVFERDMTFVSLGGRFNLGGGKAETPDFAMDPGPDGEFGLTYKGTIGLEDYALKGEMTTRFNPRTADEMMKGDVGKVAFTKDKDGWAVAIWDVRGTLFLPIPTPSVKQITGKAKAAAKEALKEAAPAAKSLLKGLLKKKK